MRTIWRAIGRVLFWSYERGTWPYDLMVAAILLFLFLTPRAWFKDQAEVGPSSRTSQIELLTEDPVKKTKTFRVDARLLALPKRTPELEQETHEVLRKNVEELRSRGFQIVHIEAVRGEDGTVRYYDVSLKH